MKRLALILATVAFASIAVAGCASKSCGSGGCCAKPAKTCGS